MITKKDIKKGVKFYVVSFPAIFKATVVDSVSCGKHGFVGFIPEGHISRYTANMQDVFKLKDTDKLKDYCEQLIVDKTETMKAFLIDIETKKDEGGI